MSLRHEGGRDEQPRSPPSARRDDPRPDESPADTEAPGGWSVLEPSVTFIRDDESTTHEGPEHPTEEEATDDVELGGREMGEFVYGARGGSSPNNGEGARGDGEAGPKAQG